MKNYIIKNGIIGGIIVAAFMLFSTYTCYKNPSGFEPSYVLGFGGMFIAFTFIFIGIKQFRDKANNGILSFGKAFQIGLLIAILVSTVYVAVWMVEYYCFFPDFMDKYSESVLSNAKSTGMNATELAAKTQEMANYKEWYKNPILIILLTYMEVLPIGIVVALISALILKKTKT